MILCLGSRSDVHVIHYIIHLHTYNGQNLMRSPVFCFAQPVEKLQVSLIFWTNPIESLFEKPKAEEEEKVDLGVPSDVHTFREALLSSYGTYAKAWEEMDTDGSGTTKETIPNQGLRALVFLTQNAGEDRVRAEGCSALEKLKA